MGAIHSLQNNQQLIMVIRIHSFIFHLVRRWKIITNHKRKNSRLNSTGRDFHSGPAYLSKSSSPIVRLLFQLVIFVLRLICVAAFHGILITSGVLGTFVNLVEVPTTPKVSGSARHQRSKIEVLTFGLSSANGSLSKSREGER